MNNQRRKAILKQIEILTHSRDEIETLAGEEEDYRDNMPESFQDGEKGQTAEAATDNFEEAKDMIDEAIAYLEGAME